MTSSDFKNLEWLTSQELKYCDFVAYARKPPEGDPYYDSLNSEITKAIYDWQKKMEELYPEETQRISSADSGDFYHGFNSGILACIRFIERAVNDPQSAIDSFPQLDT